MKQGSYLLRFVDVVLILLFGFIVISDIDEDSQIILPSSSETEQSEAELFDVIYIGITPEGTYFDERDNLSFSSAFDLQTYIQQHQNRYGDLAKVRIRANYDTQARYTIEAARICDEVGVKKSIDVRLLSR
ncbi:ExbD/TolR family protein [Rhodohalobacter sp. 8-1]|uniref:ExbD/TolR family protein n=1 Tax=Rhodohalobacter sp. 8-1 TaxID=3131972 RepID=UPI0030EC10DC